MGFAPMRYTTEINKKFEFSARLTYPYNGVDYTEVDAGGVPALWAVQKRAAKDRAIQATRGGGQA